jgi:hypothetical protein
VEQASVQTESVQESVMETMMEPAVERASVQMESVTSGGRKTRKSLHHSQETLQ